MAARGKANIDRALARLTGRGGAEDDFFVMEAIGPGGVAILIETTAPVRVPVKI